MLSTSCWRRPSSLFTSSSKLSSTYRALSGFSTHLPLIILASASLSDLTADSLVSDAVEFCGHGDCLRLKRNFFQQAMQRLVRSVQFSINLQLGGFERLNGTDFQISIHSGFLHDAFTRPQGPRIHRMNHTKVAQSRGLKNWMDDGVSNNFARFATVSSVNSMSALFPGCF